MLVCWSKLCCCCADKSSFIIAAALLGWKSGRCGLLPQATDGLYSSLLAARSAPCSAPCPAVSSASTTHSLWKIPSQNMSPAHKTPVKPASVVLGNSLQVTLSALVYKALPTLKRNCLKWMLRAFGALCIQAGFESSDILTSQVVHFKLTQGKGLHTDFCGLCMRCLMGKHTGLLAGWKPWGSLPWPLLWLSGLADPVGKLPFPA